MSAPSPAASNAVKRKSARLRRQIKKIDAIDTSFYGEADDTDVGDDFVSVWVLERKYDDRLRAIVLHLHTRIETHLNIRIMNRILGGQGRRTTRNNVARALQKLLYGRGSLGFDGKLNLAVAIGLMNSKTRGRLAELNGLRNKCSHHWLLNVPLRRGRKPKEKKPPLLIYRGRNLHKDDVLNEFLIEYIDISLGIELMDA